MHQLCTVGLVSEFIFNSEKLGKPLTPTTKITGLAASQSGGSNKSRALRVSTFGAEDNLTRQLGCPGLLFGPTAPGARCCGCS